MLPGDISGAISRWVKELLSFAGGADSEQGHGLLRKLGHFTEFTCLGLCFAWLVGMLKKHPWLGLTGGFLVACIDETIQRFVPDRGPSFRDVLIDTSGALLGIGLLFLGYTIHKKPKKQDLEDRKT